MTNKRQEKISRREMIRKTAVGISLPIFVPRAVLGSPGQPGANDRVGIGAIGVGGRASLLLNQLPEDGRIVALCDCNLPRAEAFKSSKQADWPIYQDYRQLLERKDIAAQLLKQVDVAEEERKWSDEIALWQARWHMQNWIDCMRTRQLPVADVEIGHRSISVCHLADIVRRVGHKLQWDPKTETFPDDAQANALVRRPRRKEYELPDVTES